MLPETTKQGESMKKGFTLIELLVVVLIIGILAAIALPKYQVAVMKARFIQAMLVMDAIHDAQQIYYLANGSYTDNLDELDIDMPSGKLNTSTAFRYNYDWGFCWNSGGNDGISPQGLCTLTKDPSYLRGYSSHSRQCRVGQDKSYTEMGKQVCKSVGAASCQKENDYWKCRLN